MAAGWVHATIDLIAFGRSYFDLHQYKDHPWRELGFKHREINHDWYKEFGKNWDFNDPFPLIIHMRTAVFTNPDEAEEFQSFISHDYIDKIWDTLDNNRRTEIEEYFKQLLQNPEELNRVCEINVSHGFIYRVIDGKKVVEYCPQLVKEHQRLRNYVSKIGIIKNL